MSVYKSGHYEAVAEMIYPVDLKTAEEERDSIHFF